MVNAGEIVQHLPIETQKLRVDIGQSHGDLKSYIPVRGKIKIELRHEIKECEIHHMLIRLLGSRNSRLVLVRINVMRCIGCGYHGGQTQAITAKVSSNDT